MVHRNDGSIFSSDPRSFVWWRASADQAVCAPVPERYTCYIMLLSFFLRPCSHTPVGRCQFFFTVNYIPFLTLQLVFPKSVPATSN